MSLKFVDIPKIENDIILEDLAKDLLKVDLSFQNVNIHGRPGQKQDGVDVYCRRKDSGKWIGVQCKVRSTNKVFTKEELISEVNLAKGFNPKLAEYYLYTTLSRDNATQEFAREINDELAMSGEFSFQVRFWEDIEDTLKQEQFETVYYRYYYKFFNDNLSLGHSIGKLVNLDIGFDNKIDTHYELIIGKIPKHNDDGKSVDYYRGTYYIVNLHDKRIEFFLKEHDSNRAHCFPSDIELAFDNRIDCYRICKWILSFDNFDDFIYDDNHNYKFSITSEERWKYMRNDEE